MKKLLTGLLTISTIGLLMLTSCKKNDKMVTDAGSTSSKLSVSNTSPTLSTAMINDTTTIIRFNFTAPNYTYKGAGQQNEIQIDAAGDNWKNPAATVLTSYSEGFTTFAFAKLLIGLQLPAGKQTTVNVRIANQLSAESALYSNVITLTVTPINLASFIYAVGAFQGWNAGSPDSLVSATSNGIYTGIIDFTAGNNQFLILPAKNYNNKYATTQTSTPTTTVTYNAGNNLIAPTAAGDYFVTFNLNTGAITFEQVNSYSAIGSSTPPLGNNYSVDNEMKYVNGDQQWELTIAMVETGGFKIRQNDDWTWSWGTLGTPDGVTLTDASGGNINITTVGTYKLTFNYPVAAYSISATPVPVTATYTLVQQ